MSTTKDMLDDAEFAKSRIANSNMSDDYKRLYFKLISLTTMATNGISPEEKIQKMTEAIQLLAVTQSMFVTEVDTKINVSVQKANRSQCLSCKAMKYVEDMEEKEEHQRILDEYKQTLGIDDSQTGVVNREDTWSGVIKKVITMPYPYIAIAVLGFSPYGSSII